MFQKYTKVVKGTVNSELASAWWKRARPDFFVEGKEFPVGASYSSCIFRISELISMHLDLQLAPHLRWFWYAPPNFPFWLPPVLLGLPSGCWPWCGSRLPLEPCFYMLGLVPAASLSSSGFSVAAERQSTSSVLEQQFLVELSFLIDINCQL